MVSIIIIIIIIKNICKAPKSKLVTKSHNDFVLVFYSK